jgi:hypothetical protein
LLPARYEIKLLRGNAFVEGNRELHPIWSYENHTKWIMRRDRQREPINPALSLHSISCHAEYWGSDVYKWRTFCNRWYEPACHDIYRFSDVPVHPWSVCNYCLDHVKERLVDRVLDSVTGIDPVLWYGVWVDPAYPRRYPPDDSWFNNSLQGGLSPNLRKHEYPPDYP